MTSLSAVGGKYIELAENNNLSACSITYFCNHIDGPDKSFDITGNATGCNSNQEMKDNCTTTLEAKCKDATVAIASGGAVSITVSEIDNASVGATSSSISPSTFSCADIGTKTVTLTIEDGNGNNDNCTAIVTVTDGVGLPLNWQSTTIGNSPPGTDYNFTACNPVTNETFNISGSGNNATSTTTDNVAFASQQLCGDGSITAKVENVDPNGFGGLMIRATMDAGSKQVSIFSNMSNSLRYEVRTTTNIAKSFQSFVKPNSIWLRLSRTGNTINVEYSPNGTTFLPVQSTIVTMASCVEIGLASFIFSPSGQATATFSNVSID